MLKYFFMAYCAETVASKPTFSKTVNSVCGPMELPKIFQKRQMRGNLLGNIIFRILFHEV